MSLLAQRRELNPASPTHREEIEAGGRWVAFGDPDPAELVAEIHARKVRSLVTFQRDLSFLRDVPEIEFLVVSSDPRDIEPIHALPRLRRLMFSGTYGGRVEFGRLEHLESFAVNECPRDGGLDSLFPGHPLLASLAISRWRHADLRPLAALRLRSLSLTGGLTALAGIEAQAETLERLDLDGMSDLASFEGIGALRRLEVLHLQALRRITTIDWVRELPSLRLLNIFDLKGVASLGPLAGHQHLEFVTFGRVRDLDLDPLASVPNLRRILTGRYRWNRPPTDFPMLGAVPGGHPDRVAYTALMIG